MCTYRENDVEKYVIRGTALAMHDYVRSNTFVVICEKIKTSERARRRNK